MDGKPHLADQQDKPKMEIVDLEGDRVDVGVFNNNMMMSGNVCAQRVRSYV